MRDIWAFLPQTLTASGVAALILAVKAMLRDKLSPRWQLSVWGVLAVSLLLPAGLMGRYSLINWPLLVEAARSALTGRFGELTRVVLPFPMPIPRPESFWDVLYLVYALGVLAFILRYVSAYIRLRQALRRGRPVRDGRVPAVAERYGLPQCPAVEVDGLKTAFVCGVLNPVLALPAGRETDDKVILHELLHLKYHDAALGLLITLFRCLHWCNPLMWLCADMAANDLEALCDQRVLERLEGEDRRDYGRILLDMADKKYARVPGTSSMANGAANIRRRVESIARFKLYPAGMGLVSVCVVVLLICPVLMGARARTVSSTGNRYIDMASARTVKCTTYAGAFDTYAKAVITGRADYRALCAPLSDHDALADWDDRENWLGVNAISYKDLYNRSKGYGIYGLTENNGVLEGFLVLTFQGAPNGQTWSGSASERWHYIQPLRAYKEDGRWVVTPLADAETCQSDERDGVDLGLPYIEYLDKTESFTVRALWQTCSYADTRAETDSFGRSWPELTPMPDGEFFSEDSEALLAEYTGPEEERSLYTRIGVAAVSTRSGDPRPELRAPGIDHTGLDSSGTGAAGGQWGDHALGGDWWDGPIFLSGGGWYGVGLDAPEQITADLYLNGEKAAELTLTPTNGGKAYGNYS